ncbi:MAG: hypothetical protein H8E66_14275 [Planctomycetes bacterium]|nr:hypothetical protein [Planctomycetota bacterium]
MKFRPLNDGLVRYTDRLSEWLRPKFPGATKAEYGSWLYRATEADNCRQGVCDENTDRRLRVDRFAGRRRGDWSAQVIDSDRLVVVGRDGNIAYYGSKGPGGFKPQEVEKWLKEFRDSQPRD